MRVFRIDGHDNEYKILKAMTKIAKDRKYVPQYDHIYYNAEKREIVATNGVVLLVWRTDIVEKNIVNPKNGSIELQGNIVLLNEEETIHADYERVEKVFHPFKSADIRFNSPSVSSLSCQIIGELAPHGFHFASKHLNLVNDVLGFMETVFIPKGMYSPVKFYGEYTRGVQGMKDVNMKEHWELAFYIMPAVIEHWFFNKAEQSTE